MRRVFHVNLLVAAAIIAAIILYGSLYPFVFRLRSGGDGPLLALLETWAVWPTRVDFLANVLLYCPLGYFLMAATRMEIRSCWRFGVSLGVGVALSISVELAQYYAPRVPAIRDVYANFLGTLIGAAVACVYRPGSRYPWIDRAVAQPLTSLVVAAWFAYRLVPFVPSLDVHKYWTALKPLVFLSSVTAFGLFTYAVSWLAVSAAMEAIVKKRRSLFLLPVLGAGTILAKILIVGKWLSWDEIGGAVLACALWSPLLRLSAKRRTALLAVIFSSFVLAWRLEPWDFTAGSGVFGWVPFLSLTHGSLLTNVQWLLERTFYYGTVLWLVTEVGIRMSLAAPVLALALLGMSVAELYLSGRPAEVTDACMVLIIATMVAAMRPPPVGGRAVGQIS